MRKIVMIGEPAAIEFAKIRDMLCDIIVKGTNCPTITFDSIGEDLVDLECAISDFASNFVENTRPEEVLEGIAKVDAEAPDIEEAQEVSDDT
jgi:hypothetical protein